MAVSLHLFDGATNAYQEPFGIEIGLFTGSKLWRHWEEAVLVDDDYFQGLLAQKAAVGTS